MVAISIEVELEGVPPDAVGSEGVAPPGDEVVSTLTTWWATNVLDPFLPFPEAQRLDPIDVTMGLIGAPNTFGIRFDENLLSDLLEAYAVHGWPAIEKVERLVADCGGLVMPTLDFVRATRNVVAVMVADSLMRLESTSASFAQSRWEAARRQLDVWLDQFTVLRLSPLPIITDRKVSKLLVTRCHEYAELRARALALQQVIDERNRKAPPAKRLKGSGADLWFEVYATPQRKILAEMGDKLAVIGSTFGAAVLVLDDLPAKVLDVHDQLRQEEADVALSGAIYRRLSGLSSDLDALMASLTKPPVTAVLAPVVNPVRAGDTSGLARLKPPDGGFEKQVLDLVFERGDGDQRLFADLGLLDALLAGDAVAVGTTDQVVLFRYMLILADEVARRRGSDANWAAFWSVLEKLGAALGLLALMAVFPFGEAAAPALVTALAWAGSAAAAVGVFVLVLHQVIGSLQEAGQLDRTAREKLFRLGQNDPTALRDIAETLARSHAVREAVENGALLTVLTLGAARTLKPIALALDFQAYLGDVETLFGPTAAADAAVDPSSDGPPGG